MSANPIQNVQEHALTPSAGKNGNVVKPIGPSPPRWVSVALQKGASINDDVLHLTRGYAAAFPLSTTESRLLQEFGKVVYGPPRGALEEARADLRDLRLTFAASEAEFRKEVAMKGGEG